MKAINSKKGSYTLEAAIFLPIFIVSVLTIGYILKLIAVQENIFHSLTDESRRLAAEASVVAQNPLFTYDLKHRIRDENGRELGYLDVSDFDYRFSSGGYSEQICIRLNYDVSVLLPAAPVKSLSLTDTVLCRAFVGKYNGNRAMSENELTEAEPSRTVWVFPRAGTKYHAEDCSFIVVCAKETALDGAVRSKYKPCKLCNPENLKNGSLVYCFENSGKAYHTGSCTSVDRYVISMEQAEAEMRGYGPCLKCGGGN
jgi:hypothetical protein